MRKLYIFFLLLMFFVVGDASSQTNSFVQVGSIGTTGLPESRLSVRTVADLNKDGFNDIVAWDDFGIIRTYFNSAGSPGTFGSNSPTFSTLPNYTDFAAGDVDNDGDIDVACSNGKVYLNNGTGTFTQLVGLTFKLTTTTGTISLLKIADLNGDGKKDIVWLNGGSSAPNYNEVWLNTGTTGSAAFTFYSSFLNSEHDRASVDLGDIDGDGDIDLVSGKFNSGVDVWKNDGTGNFGNFQSAGHYSTTAQLGDWDKDGDLDLLVFSGYNASGFKVSLNNGSGTFAPSTTIYNSIAVNSNGRFADLNGDGLFDGVLGNHINPGKVLLNNGCGFVLHPGDLSNSYNGITAADVTGDGKPDLICAARDALSGIWKNDLGPAAAIPPPVTPILSNVTGQCSATAPIPTTTDYCGRTVNGTTTNPLTYTTPGTHVINWSFTDIYGNVITTSQNVIINDVTNPTIACPANISTTATSSAGAIVNYTAPVGTDNCTGATTTRIAGPASGQTFPVGITTVTHRVTDVAGLTAQCSFTVTVSGQAPQINCPGNITVNNTPGQCGATVTFAATEIAGIPASTITYSVQPGSLFNKGTATITATATNSVGSSSCTFTVTVNDNESPVFSNASGGGGSVPSHILANVLEASQYQLVYQLPIPNAASWSSTAQVPYSVNNVASLSGASYNRVAYYMELTSGGGSKWVWVSMDKFTNNIAELGIPAGSIVFQQKVNKMNVIASSNSGITSGNEISTGNIEFWSGCYSPGNALNLPGANGSIYDFDDIGNSTTSCYGSFQVHNYGAQKTIFAYNSFASGGAGADDLGIGNSGGQHPDWTFANNSGSYTVKNLYVFISNGNITTNTDLNSCSATLSVNPPPATDNCGQVTVNGVRDDNQPISAAYQKGITTITWTATDGSGNTTSTDQTVTVIDNQLPTIACPANITTTATSAAGAFVNYNAPVGTDNCPGATTTRITGPASGETFPMGTTTVTYQVVDASNNMVQCSFTVTVAGLAPQIVCPANINANNTEVQCGANVAFTATETTGIPASTITYSHQPGSFFPVGTTAVTATATNVVGVSSCIFNVVVTDNQKPVITSNGDKSVNNDANSCGAMVEVSASATDNCTVGAPTGVRSDGQALTALYPVGTTTITWNVKDVNDVAATAVTQTVVVTDNQEPAIYTNNLTIQLDPSGQASITETQVNNGSSDACGIQSMSLSKTSFTCSDIGTHTVTLTVVDNNGNTNSNTATVTVVGAIPSPSITVSRTDLTNTGVGTEKTIFMGYGAQSLTLSAGNTTSSQANTQYNWSPATFLSPANAIGPSVVYTPNATQLGYNTITVTATNEFGCVNSVTEMIRVIDARCENGKVLVCKKPAGKNPQAQELCVSPNAIPAHLANGGKLGACSNFDVITTRAKSQQNPVSKVPELVQKSIKVFPNPNNGQFVLQLNNQKAGRATVTIYNVTGDVMERRNVDLKGSIQSLSFNLSDLASGVYFVNITSEDGSFQNEKVIVQK